MTTSLSPPVPKQGPGGKFGFYTYRCVALIRFKFLENPCVRNGPGTEWAGPYESNDRSKAIEVTYNHRPNNAGAAECHYSPNDLHTAIDDRLLITDEERWMLCQTVWNETDGPNWNVIARYSVNTEYVGYRSWLGQVRLYKAGSLYAEYGGAPFERVP